MSVLLGVADALLENLLGFFDKLAVQIDGVAGDLTYSVVLAEDELGSLLVVFVGFGCVGLALLRQLMRRAAVAALVGLLGLRSKVLVLALLFTSKITESIVFTLRICRGTVVEGWSIVSWRRLLRWMCLEGFYHGLRGVERATWF